MEDIQRMHAGSLCCRHKHKQKHLVSDINFLFGFVLIDRVSSSPGWLLIFYAARNDIECLILLKPPPIS